MVLIEMCTASAGNDLIARPGSKITSLHRAIIGQHRDECFRPGSCLRGTIGDFRSEMLQFVSAASRAVVNHQVVARLNEVAGHARSHIAETNISDFHDVPFLAELSFSAGVSSWEAILHSALREE